MPKISKNILNTAEGGNAHCVVRAKEVVARASVRALTAAFPGLPPGIGGWQAEAPCDSGRVRSLFPDSSAVAHALHGGRSRPAEPAGGSGADPLGGLQRPRAERRSACVVFSLMHNSRILRVLRE